MEHPRELQPTGKLQTLPPTPQAEGRGIGLVILAGLDHFMHKLNAVLAELTLQVDESFKDLDSYKELNENQKALMDKLQARYTENKHDLPCHDEVTWNQVAVRLLENPEKLLALQKMEEAGGEPDMTGIEDGKFLFDDLAKKLPVSRRSLNYDEALAAAKAMGEDVELMSPQHYKWLGDEVKIVMDIGEDWVWLKSSQTKPDQDMSIGKQFGRRVVFKRLQRDMFNENLAFRCSLRV